MIFGNILYFLMLFAPRAWQFLKMPLVVVVVIMLAFYYIRNKRMQLNGVTIKWFTILVCFGIVWSLTGALKDNPGVFDFFRLNVIWVVLYALFVFYIDSMEKFRSLLTTMVYATIAISLYNIAIVLNALSSLPDLHSFLKIDADLTSSLGIHEGYIQMQSHNLGSLTFLAPFVLSIFVMKPCYSEGISRKTLLTAVVLSIVTVIISGRRALWLEMMVTPLFILAFNYFAYDDRTSYIAKRTIKICAATIVLLVAIGSLLAINYDWQFGGFQERFTSAFVTEDIRSEQAAALWNGFKESPILGSGFGIGVPEVVRNDEYPWMYELSYMLILYNTGLIGSILYAVCLGMIFYYGFRIIGKDQGDKSIIISLLIAFSCFIIANATNPYFASYDFMWVLFLPVCYINVVLSKQEHGL